MDRVRRYRECRWDTHRVVQEDRADRVDPVWVVDQAVRPVEVQVARVDPVVRADRVDHSHA